MDDDDVGGSAAESSSSSNFQPMEQAAMAGCSSNSNSLSTTAEESSNSRQFSLISVNTVEYAIPVELQFVDYLGGGNYGNVIKVRSPEGHELAVKKMYEPFSHEIKARRVYRELKLLQLISHENIIRFVDVYSPDRELRSFKNVYIVSSFAGISLKQVLDRQKQLGVRLINQDHIKYICYQLLRALKYLHSANVIHRDLKPSNLAITEQCDLTVLDFGLARTVSGDTADNLTAYVISRWYRSPEVIYWNNVSYNAKADVWSVGCILAELMTQKVLFPGSEAMEQYKLIIRLCGSPDVELMNKIEQQNSPAMRMVIERMSGHCERKDFRRVFSHCPAQAVDLLGKLLVLDPDRRISVEEALEHPYMADYHLPEDEQTVDEPFNIEDNCNNTGPRTLADWREIVWHELQLHEQRKWAQQQQQQEQLDMEISSSPSHPPLPTAITTHSSVSVLQEMPAAEMPPAVDHNNGQNQLLLVGGDVTTTSPSIATVVPSSPILQTTGQTTGQTGNSSASTSSTPRSTTMMANSSNNNTPLVVLGSDDNSSNNNNNQTSGQAQASTSRQQQLPQCSSI